MKPYFAYIRVSTQRQGQGVSLQEQRGAIEAHAVRFGLTVTEWFEEKETAAKEGRNVFSAMVRQLEGRAAQGVIIHKIDRGARNLSDWANLGKLFDRGIDVQFAHDSIDLRSRGGRLSADILAVVASDYVRNLREEVRKGFYGRLKQGFYPLPAPIGYLNNGGGKPKTIDPVSGPLIRWAFEQYSRGRISLQDLAKELTNKGLRPPLGGKVSVQTLSQILRNKFYTGTIYLESTKETFAGAHQPLVTQQLFNQVQKALSRKAPRKAVLHDLAFRLFIRCGSCHRHLTGERKKGRHVYYRCFFPPCRGAVLKEEEVCAVLREEIGLLQLSAGELGDLRDIVSADIEVSATKAVDAQSQLRRKLGHCDERMSRLTDALVDGLIDKDAYEARKADLIQKRQTFREQLDNPDSALSPAQKVLKNLELPNIEQIGLESATPGDLRKIAETMTSNFSVTGRTPVFEPQNPFLTIRNWRLSSRVHRIMSHFELLRLYEMMKSAESDNDLYEVPNVPQVPAASPTRTWAA